MYQSSGTVYSLVRKTEQITNNYTASKSDIEIVCVSKVSDLIFKFAHFDHWLWLVINSKQEAVTYRYHISEHQTLLPAERNWF